MREAGLKLVVAHLLVPGMAFGAMPARRHERHRDAVADFPFLYLLAHRFHHARELVVWNVGELDVGVVAHPAMPVAAADPRGHDLDDRAMGFGCGVWAKPTSPCWPGCNRTAGRPTPSWPSNWR